MDRKPCRVPMVASVSQHGELVGWKDTEDGRTLYLVRHAEPGVPHERNGPRAEGRMRRLFWYPSWMVEH